MHTGCSLLFTVLAFLGVQPAVSIWNPLIDEMPTPCPKDGILVCGMKGRQLVLFSNECLLNEINMESFQNEPMFVVVPMENCLYHCRLYCPDIFHPVCAKNMETERKEFFRNQCELNEHICRRNTKYEIVNLSECRSTSYFKRPLQVVNKKRSLEGKKRRPIGCTNVLNPVCGFYMGVKSSFRNECLLNAENVAYNRDWRIFNNDMCPQDYATTRRHEAKPAKTHSIKKRSYRNNLYNFHQDEHEYSANSFVDKKSKMKVPASDLYVYMPPTVHTQYHPAMPVHDGYDEIFNKIASFPAAQMPIMKQDGEKEVEKPISEQVTIRPQSFVANRVNLNYLSDQNLIRDINRQSVFNSENSLIEEDHPEYYYNLDSSKEDNKEMLSGLEISSQTTQLPTTTSDSNRTTKVFKEQKQEIPEQIKTCKFGTVEICATLANATLRTFINVCDMMSANIYLNNTWTKLHDGVCENCKYNCSRDYQPICVSRNGVNYTMVNECYYNMAICMDKKSKWLKLGDNECERYTRIIDKYLNSKPGFPYTSNYFVSETTAMPSMESATPGTTTKSLAIEHSESESPIGDSKAPITRNRRLSSRTCCSRSHNADQITQDNINCECWNDTTQVASTESHIMSLVKNKGEPRE